MCYWIQQYYYHCVLTLSVSLSLFILLVDNSIIQVPSTWTNHIQSHSDWLHGPPPRLAVDIKDTTTMSQYRRGANQYNVQLPPWQPYYAITAGHPWSTNNDQHVGPEAGSTTQSGRMGWQLMRSHWRYNATRRQTSTSVTNEHLHFCVNVF